GSIFDVDVPGLDVAEITKSFAKGVVKDLYARRRREAEVPYPGDPLWLLRARRKRPRGRRAADQRDELAPFHCPVLPRAFGRDVSTPQYGRRLLRCGIAIQAMTARGHSRRISPSDRFAARPLRSDPSEVRRRSESTRRANSRLMHCSK